jgi:hypothetical protein
VTIQDPILLPLKDSIRAEGGQLTLDEVQQKFVDIVEGRKADALSQSTRHRQVKSVTRPLQQNKNKKGKKKGIAAKTRAAAQGGHATIEPKKRKASERLSNEEIALLKVSNPEDWFLTTKTIPPESFKEMSLDERKLMKKFRETESRVLKAVRTGVIQSITVAEPSVIIGTQLGPNETLTPEEAPPIITQLNPTVDNNPPVPTTPTVQFGRAAHQPDVAQTDE